MEEKENLQEKENVQEETTQYLTFHLGEESYALEILRVREILDYTKITRVPGTPDFMLGVINLRGSVVPIVDMNLKLGLSQVERTINTCIIILEIKVDDDIAIFGALADSVNEVIELTANQIEPPPKIGTCMKTEFLKGMGKDQDRFVLLLEIDRIFSTEELTLAQESKESSLIEA